MISKKILVVDDEKIIRSMLKRYLQNRGHTIKTARNGLEAAAVIEKEIFDVVITDLRMELVDGFEVCHLVKKQSPDTGVIVVTGSAYAENEEKAFTCGADYFLPKPIDFNQLLSSLSHLQAPRRLCGLENDPAYPAADFKSGQL